ncbi:hypothetical protein N334_05384, partial [Pelecanus crispus]
KKTTPKKARKRFKTKSNHDFQVYVSKVCREHGLELMPWKAPQPRFVHLKCKFGVCFIFSV